MKVVLIKNYDKLGRIGEVKEISDGYVQNFLIPNKIVLPATTNNIERAKKQKLIREQKKKVVGVDKNELLNQLKNYTVSILEKADEKGTLFAGVTNAKIASELIKKGFQVKPKQIKLDSPIKKVGTFKVNIIFDKGMKTTLVVVVKES
jgi:large subunit ribosomal protein L9